LIDEGGGYDLAEFTSNDNWINLDKTGYQYTGDVTDKLVSIESIHEGSGDDTLIGHKKHSNLLVGGYSEDWIEPGTYSDVTISLVVQ